MQSVQQLMTQILQFVTPAASHPSIIQFLDKAAHPVCSSPGKGKHTNGDFLLLSTVMLARFGTCVLPAVCKHWTDHLLFMLSCDL